MAHAARPPPQMVYPVYYVTSIELSRVDLATDFCRIDQSFNESAMAINGELMNLKGPPKLELSPM
jgi:hypothetical protein